MKRAQEEFNLVSAMLVPVIAFLLLLIVLYINFIPVIDVYQYVLIFAHDVGALYESAYAVPGDIRFVYNGPVPCYPDYSRGELICKKGNTYINITVGSEARTYSVDTAKYALFDLGYKSMVFHIPKVAWINFPYKDRYETFTGVKMGEGTAIYFSEPSTMDYMLRSNGYVSPYLALGGLMISKEQKKLFGTLSQEDVDNIGVDFIASKVMNKCKKCGEGICTTDESFDVILPPTYFFYTLDSKKLCLAKFYDGGNFKDVECFNFADLDEWCGDVSNGEVDEIVVSSDDVEMKDVSGVPILILASDNEQQGPGYSYLQSAYVGDFSHKQTISIHLDVALSTMYVKVIGGAI